MLIGRLTQYTTAAEPNNPVNFKLRGVHAIQAHGYQGEGNNIGAGQLVDNNGNLVGNFNQEISITLIPAKGNHTNVIECRLDNATQDVVGHIGIPGNHNVYGLLDAMRTDAIIGQNGGVKFMCNPIGNIVETADGFDVAAGHAIAIEAEIEIHDFDEDNHQVIQNHICQHLWQQNGGNRLQAVWEDLTDSSSEDDS